MDCPKCGYVMSDLDAECARCRRMDQQVKDPPPTAGPDPLADLVTALPPTAAPLRSQTPWWRRDFETTPSPPWVRHILDTIGGGVIIWLIIFLYFYYSTTPPTDVPVAPVAPVAPCSGTLTCNVGMSTEVFDMNAFFKPDPGCMFIATNVNIHNGTNETVSVGGYCLKFLADNVEYGSDLSATCALRDDYARLQAVRLQPGGTTQGYVCFQVPQSIQRYGFRWVPIEGTYKVQINY